MNLLLQAEIFSVTGHGKLRVTYNWLYSALNCDPNDNSTFLWNFYDMGNGHVAISPQNGYNNMKLFASVRDDWNWYVQVQAPHSADWITAAQRDEVIGLQMLDLGLAKLTGFNNQWIGVLDQPDGGNIRTNGKDTGSHTGYRVQSLYTSPVKETIWFIKIISGGTNTGTSGINVVTRIGVQIPNLESGLQGVLQQQGVNLSAQELSTLIQQINT
jgi:hypothetical protein